MITKIIKDIVDNDLKRVAIVTHKYPDYDALCSTNALAEIIHQGVINYKHPNWKQLSFNEHMEIISREAENATYVLPVFQKTDIGEYHLASCTFRTEEDGYANLLKQISFDAVIVCDVNEQDRVFGEEILNRVSKEHIYLFDHHMGNRNELDILPENKLVEQASSTCEIILNDALKENIDVSIRAMSDIYAGIVTDTCVFLFGVNDFTLKVKNNSFYGLDQTEKEEIEDIFNRLYEEDEYNLQHLQKIDYGVEGWNIYFLNKPKISKKRGTYVNSALEKAIMPGDNEISVLFAVYDGYTEIKFRKGKNSKIMISELAKYFNGGGNEDRAAARVQGKSLIELIEHLNNYQVLLSNQDSPSLESTQGKKK